MFKQEARDFMDAEDDPLVGQHLEVASASSAAGGVASRVARSVDRLGQRADEFSVPMMPQSGVRATATGNKQQSADSRVKTNNFGLGFDPFQAAEEFRKRQVGGAVGPPVALASSTRLAFGVGSASTSSRIGLSALEDEDDDIYETGRKTNYAQEVVDPEESDRNQTTSGPARVTRRTSVDAFREEVDLPGFVPSRFSSNETAKIMSGEHGRGTMSSQRAPYGASIPPFRAPRWFPRNFRHRFLRSLDDERRAALMAATGNAVATGKFRGSSESSASISEASAAATTSKHMNKRSGRGPPEWAARFASSSATPKSPNLLESRFTRAEGSGSGAANGNDPLAKPTKTFEVRPAVRAGLSSAEDFARWEREQVEKEKAAAEGRGSNADILHRPPPPRRRPRKVLDWMPEPLLCKRLNVPPPLGSETPAGTVPVTGRGGGPTQKTNKNGGGSEGLSQAVLDMMKEGGGGTDGQRGRYGRDGFGLVGESVVAEPSWETVEQDLDALFSLFD